MRVRRKEGGRQAGSTANPHLLTDFSILVRTQQKWRMNFGKYERMPPRSAVCASVPYLTMFQLFLQLLSENPDKTA